MANDPGSANGQATPVPHAAPWPHNMYAPIVAPGYQGPPLPPHLMQPHAAGQPPGWYGHAVPWALPYQPAHAGAGGHTAAAFYAAGGQVQAPHIPAAYSTYPGHQMNPYAALYGNPTSHLIQHTLPPSRGGPGVLARPPSVGSGASPDASLQPVHRPPPLDKGASGAVTHPVNGVVPAVASPRQDTQQADLTPAKNAGQNARENDGPSAPEASPGKSSDNDDASRKRRKTDATSGVHVCAPADDQQERKDASARTPTTEDTAAAQLEDDLTQFIADVVPTPAEHQRADDSFRALSTSISQSLGINRAQVCLFGSYATGLCIHCSDIDVVIVGLCQPDPQFGHYKATPMLQRRVGALLDTVKRGVQVTSTLEYHSMELIRHARVPILKMCLANDLHVDISITNDTGVRAAKFLNRLHPAFPAFRPLVLLLKCLLKEHKLNDVAVGGLGSFSLANMVLAFLQEQAKLPGGCPQRVGVLLQRVLEVYGCEFDYMDTAVAFQHGGFVSKAALGFERRDRLAVADPITGRDISGGTMLISKLRSTFAEAACRMRNALHDGTPVLHAIMDVPAALSRQKVPFQHAGSKRGR